MSKHTRTASVNFRDLKITNYFDTSKNDPIKEFYEPLLSVAIHYDRGVGYFSSGWFRVAAEGMVAFANNGGKARWITSPILSEDDWQAILEGDKARRDIVLKDGLKKNIIKLSESLKKDTLSALAWLIADEIISIKLAIPSGKLTGEFHDKFGIFTDNEGLMVSFNGSPNDSIQGTRNYEAFKVFFSWEKHFSDLVSADKERFERLWYGLDENVRVFDLPEAAREKIVSLRSSQRPYEKPKFSPAPSQKPQKPNIPNEIILRDYQCSAIDAWFENGCQGILEMATGTGKTITALAASVRLSEKKGRLFLIVAAPFLHLVDQWGDIARNFGFLPILAYESKNKWFERLNGQIVEFKRGHRNYGCVITSHATFNSIAFQDTIKNLDDSSVLIADEVHHLGAENSREMYPNNILNRLALSATPTRWFDETGTQSIESYFGSTVFSFGLKEAIERGYLSEYYYYPHLVYLTADELNDYFDISLKIAIYFNKDDEASKESLKMLLIKRAGLLNTATNKISILSGLVDNNDNIKHSLFYCAPKQIDDVLHLLGYEKGFLVHPFTAKEGQKERQRLLDMFASGAIDGLVAMKCLDEGVDVPNTRVAYILASSSNPREFIQRRGRILRKSEGKKYSVIHDLITLPTENTNIIKTEANFEIERNMIRKELSRFKEFSSVALNKHEAIDIIWDVAKVYGLMDF